MKKVFTVLTALLLTSIGAFAQSNVTLKGDVNGDGQVNMLDVTATVDIILKSEGTPGYFYLGTTRPTAENYQSLVGVSASYTSIAEAAEGTASISVADDETVYLLCPAAWVAGKSVELLGGSGETISFMDEKDGITISGYVIYKTSALNGENSVGLKTGDPTFLSSCPDGNHPHIIDLGLPSGTKWACCNVDAHAPEEVGGYYAWGETEEKSDYNWETYQHGYYDPQIGDPSTLLHIGYDISGTKYDVAHKRWGQGWHMPNETQIQELIDNTTAEWYSEDGIEGCQLIGPNGSNIFIPVSGFMQGKEDGSAQTLSLIWSSSTEIPTQEPYFDSPFSCTLIIRPFTNPYQGFLINRSLNLEWRSEGLTVRPVK